MTSFSENSPTVRTVAVIVAAGSGTRAGPGAAPKQYRSISGRCAVQRCLEAFAAHPAIDQVLTVIREEDRALFHSARDSAASRLSPSARAKIMEAIPGGAERQESVKLALEGLATGLAPDLVAIHDAARPFLPTHVLEAALSAARRFGGACVAEPLADTLRRETLLDGRALAGEITPRDGLWRAQTPQIFDFSQILTAHREHGASPATDDAEIARRGGMRVALTNGAPALMKITRPEDFAFAEAIAAWMDAVPRPGRSHTSTTERTEEMTEMRPEFSPDIRVGQGFDVHRFGPNADGSRDHVMLCGVAVPHEDGLLGHSDADVGLHALTDAILGAAALGDIGRHFPPSEERWRGASSDQFLAHAVALASEAGGRPTLLDVTLICERPKIGPHVAEMRSRIAEITGVDIVRVSVKATTSEGLGFTGRGEGIAAMASATLAFGA